MRRKAALAFFAMFLCWNMANPLAAAGAPAADPAASIPTKTPIKHVVVIVDENISFDHYFATYPNAANLPGETSTFHALPNTPAVNGLTPTMITNNPNAISGGGSNPFRLTPSQAATCNPTNAYTKEQQAFDGGVMDQFSKTSTTASCGFYLPAPPQVLTMGYYDGNTVTALWNYAQHYAMSDNFFDSTFGTTVMGHTTIVSGNSSGLYIKSSGSVPVTTIYQSTSEDSIVSNVQPFYDDCAGATPNVVMTGKNIGDVLNAANVSWGWFYGDFAPVTVGSATTSATCTSIYNNHYAPFNYYQSTANPHHIPPASLTAIGTDTCSNMLCANHNYDLSYLYSALNSGGNLPAVTYVEFSENSTGHAADSSPLLEQTALVTLINAIQESPYWKDTAIMIMYDDSGGWYDHVAGPIVNFSTDPVNDAISGTPAATGGTGSCGKPNSSHPVVDEDRCGFGVRMPFLVISPYAKANYVDHSLNDTSSVMRFIEYNWSLPHIGDPQSFDVLASGTITGMFDFTLPPPPSGHTLFLNPSSGMPE